MCHVFFGIVGANLRHLQMIYCNNSVMKLRYYYYPHLLIACFFSEM